MHRTTIAFSSSMTTSAHTQVCSSQDGETHVRITLRRGEVQFAREKAVKDADMSPQGNKPLQVTACTSAHRTEEQCSTDLHAYHP